MTCIRSRTDPHGSKAVARVKRLAGADKPLGRIRTKVRAVDSRCEPCSIKARGTPAPGFGPGLFGSFRDIEVDHLLQLLAEFEYGLVGRLQAAVRFLRVELCGRGIAVAGRGFRLGDLV